VSGHESWCTEGDHPEDSACAREAEQVGEMSSWLTKQRGEPVVRMAPEKQFAATLSLDETERFGRSVLDLAAIGRGGAASTDPGDAGTRIQG
jgi:hypothetical protein